MERHLGSCKMDVSVHLVVNVNLDFVIRIIVILRVLYKLLMESIWMDVIAHLAQNVLMIIV